MKDKIYYLLAKILYRLGVKPRYSRGICGSLTIGYGKLDDNGYWQFMLHEEAATITYRSITE